MVASPYLDKQQFGAMVAKMSDNSYWKREKWFWLSFCDSDLPEGEQLLGVVVIRAGSFLTAVRLAHQRGINPGGECAGLEFPPVELDEAKFGKWLNRCLSRDEAGELDAALKEYFNQ